MTRKISRTLVATVAACLLAFSSLGHARAVDESPSALAMTADAVLLRPALLAAHQYTHLSCSRRCPPGHERSSRGAT